MKFTLEYADNGELVAKLKTVAARFGYRMERVNPDRLTVGQLAKLVHRNLSNVSARLRSPHCPPFVSAKGKRRILWLEPNDALLSFLQNAVPGQRTDLDPRRSRRTD